MGMFLNRRAVLSRYRTKTTNYRVIANDAIARGICIVSWDDDQIIVA